MIDLSLGLSIIACIILIIFINRKAKGKDITKSMSMLFISLIVWCLGLVLQRLLLKIYPGFNPIYADYITYIGICFTPPLGFIMANIYSGNNIKKITKILIFIIPIISLLLLWTNDWHNLFYKVYSINFDEAIYGPMFDINRIYSYFLVLYFMFIMLKTSIIKSGFFSIQTTLITIGSFVPLIINILGTMRIIVISIYITPILFVVSVFFYALAIIKFKALNVIPVAFKTVFDTMTDAFVVISDDGTIADMNKTFKNTFKNILILDGKDNLLEGIKTTKTMDYDLLVEYLNESKEKKNIITKEWNIKIEEIVKYFNVDIQAIKAKSGNEYVAYLLIFRDITNQKKDMEILTKKENLLILGELAGGMAHDINTPISSINMCIKTMERTIKDDVNKELLKSMETCTAHIIGIVNSLRDQIRNIGDKQKQKFTVNKILQNVEIMTTNEFIKNNCELEINSSEELEIFGEANKLTQVIINIVMNSVQAYSDKNTKDRKVIITTKSNLENNIIQIKDFAGGIPERIKPFIFKEILTTKGTIGTGVGMYISYSIVKGVFGGDITFESVEGVGTEFIIYIPKNNEEGLI